MKKRRSRRIDEQPGRAQSNMEDSYKQYGIKVYYKGHYIALWFIYNQQEKNEVADFNKKKKT